MKAVAILICYILLYVRSFSFVVRGALGNARSLVDSINLSIASYVTE